MPRLVWALPRLLAACGPPGCQNLPVCVDPYEVGRKSEVQPSGPLSQTVVVPAGRQVEVTVWLDRHGLPPELPVALIQTIRIDRQGQYQDVQGVLLFSQDGVTLTAASNPVRGDQVQLTVQVAPGTPPGDVPLDVLLQKQGTRYNTAGHLNLNVQVP